MFNFKEFFTKDKIIKTEMLNGTLSIKHIKKFLNNLNKNEDLINIGAYKKGSNPNVDFAIEKLDEVNQFLLQETDEKFTFEETIELLKGIFVDG